MNSARPMEHLKRKYFILEENLYLLGWGPGELIWLCVVHRLPNVNIPYGHIIGWE